MNVKDHVLSRESQRGANDILSQQNGMSLVDALVAASILGVVILSYLGWVQMSGREMSSIKESHEIANVILRVNQAFGNDDKVCTEMMKNTPLSMAGGSEIPAMHFWDTSTVIPTKIASQVILEKDKTIPGEPGLNVKKFEIVPVRMVETNVILGNFEITFEKLNATGPKEIIRRIPVQAVVSAGQIQKCSISPTTSIYIAEAFCMLKNYGYAVYNPVTGACDMAAGVAWYSGATPYEAACPAGTQIAVASLASPEHAANVACNVEGANNLDIPSRTYVSGYVDDTPIQYAVRIIDIPNNKCKFVYISGSDPSAYQPKVKCVKISQAL